MRKAKGSIKDQVAMQKTFDAEPVMRCPDVLNLAGYGSIIITCTVQNWPLRWYGLFKVRTFDPTNTSMNVTAHEGAVSQIVYNFFKSGGIVQGSFIQVLQTDEAAWNDAYKLNPDKMQREYQTLIDMGGNLQLRTSIQKLMHKCNKQKD